MSTPEEIFAAVQSLDPSDRWQLVTRLWDALPPQETVIVDDATLAEFDRRYAELESGQVEAVPADEVRRLMRSWVNRNG